MCKHKYNFVEPEGMGCEWFNLFSKGFNEPNLTPAFQNLPLDNQGVCIFHSTDIEWKRENYFFERFIDICFYLNNSSSETEIRFNDVQFVGIKPNDTLDDTGKPYIELSNLIINKDILVYDSTFHDTINIERCIFKKGISIETSVFKNGVTLSNNTFKGDFEIYGNCTFEDTLRFLFFNTFYGKLDLMNVNFENNFDLDDVVFFDSVEIDTCSFVNKEEYINLHCDFKKGISLRKNLIKSNLYIDNCNFEGDSIFEDNFQTGKFRFKESNINGKIEFIGTPENMLFEPNTIFEIKKDSFGVSGHILFDYCKVLNLGNEILNKIKEYENLSLFTVLATCKVARLTIERTYQYSKINNYILEDFTTFLSRFYDYYHAVNLNIDFIRDLTKKTIKVIFKTSDNIDENEFYYRLNNLSKKINDLENLKSDPIVNDLKNIFQSIFQRLNDNYKNKFISLEEINEILTFQGLFPTIQIVINNSKIDMATKIDLKGASIGTLQTGENAVSSTFIQNLGNLLTDNNIPQDKRDIILSQADEINKEEDVEKRKKKWGELVKEYLPTLAEAGAIIGKEMMKP